MESNQTLNLIDWVVAEGTRLGSLNRLAKALGVTQSTIMRWRNGKITFLKDDACAKIAQYLGVEKSAEEMRQMFGMPAHPWMEVYGKPEDVGVGRKDKPYQDVNIRSLAFQDLCDQVKELQAQLQELSPLLTKVTALEEELAKLKKKLAELPKLESKVASLEDEVSLQRIENRELKEFIEVLTGQQYVKSRAKGSQVDV
jgi:transcriptional regulator with XRE-family HTH domain